MPIASYKLHRARAAKNDEFYTQYADVKKECDNYLSHFFNKIIYCNCDTADSAFVKYFTELKDAGLIRDVWYSGGLGGMDFRSAEAIEKLKAADIVITNPPFSLFREFMDLIFMHNKKFLVIGNKNAIAYKNIFCEIQNGNVHIGVRRFAQVMWFVTPSNEYKSVPAVWFTNIAHKFPRPFLSLHKKYNACEFPHYDNADAINVNHVADIPHDYDGIMGVPISFIDKYNPAQFQILGMGRDFTYDKRGVILNNQKLYHRIFIKNINLLK